MKKTLFAMMALFLVSSSGAWAAKVGEPAPPFSGAGSDGKTYQLSDFSGKYVVLEWHNEGCPYVRKYYGSGAMQKLQSQWRKKGVVWLTILSSSRGKQGFQTAASETAYLKEKHAHPTAAILDPTGAIARAYGAKTTPHMFVIAPDGKLIYDGAIDDKPTTDPADLAGAKNYVSAALTEAMANQPVADSSTRPYGCSVKYNER